MGSEDCYIGKCPDKVLLLILGMDWKHHLNMCIHRVFEKEFEKLSIFTIIDHLYYCIGY